MIKENLHELKSSHFQPNLAKPFKHEKLQSIGQINLDFQMDTFIKKISIFL